jgi:hypothetical protein
MNEVRTKQIASLLAEALRDALKPLYECIEQTTARLSAVEAGIRAAEARRRTIATLKRAVGASVDGDATAIGGDHVR